MSNDLKKLVKAAHFPSVLRLFNNSMALNSFVVIKSKDVLIEDLGQLILDDNTTELMQLVKDNKVSFDADTINTYGYVQSLIIGEYLIIKNISNQN